MEAELYSKFVQLLNAKKQKINGIHSRREDFISACVDFVCRARNACPVRPYRTRVLSVSDSSVLVGVTNIEVCQHLRDMSVDAGKRCDKRCPTNRKGRVFGLVPECISSYTDVKME